MDLQNIQNMFSPTVATTVSSETLSLDKINDSIDENVESSEKEDRLSKRLGESLPVQATSNDVREIVRFLKNKPLGLSFGEILSAEPRRIFDSRKIDAYEYWGIIQRVGERVKLTDIGDKLADVVSTENEIFLKVISSVPIYVEIIKWLDQQKINLVTHLDINEFFVQIQQKGQYIRITEAEVVSFFSLCHAAELGISTVGKRGQPARLRIDSQKIEEFLLKNSSQRFLSNSKQASLASQRYTKNVYEDYSESSLIQRIYISGSASDTAVAESLFETLEIADFESIVFDTEETADYLQSDKLEKMRFCQAGILIINEQDCVFDKKEGTKIKSERLTEIIAAAGLFNWRIVIIWNNKFPVPAFFQNYSLQLLVNTSNTFKVSYQAVKLLKEMKTALSD